jgi:ferritin-like metal-binding protein YciE
MPKVTDPRDLLVRDLAVVYSAEKAIERTLPKMAKEANDPELSRGLERHLDETRQHVTNLEEVFRLLGEKPRATKSAAIEGLTLEHKGFAADAADDIHPEVLDLVALRSATATEHHEISAYESLITLAKGVGEAEIVPFLERNLEQERQMLANAKELARRLGSQDDPDLTEDLRSGIDRERATRLAADEITRPETLGPVTRARTPGL